MEKAPNQPDVTEEHPGKDDVSLCIGCGEPAIFNEDLSVRKPTPDEYAEILRDVTVRKIRTAILMCRHRNN